MVSALYYMTTMCEWRQLVWIQSHDTVLSLQYTLVPVTVSCKASQNPATSLVPSLRRKTNESPAKLLTLWYSRAGFARLPVTYNTYTPTVYCSHTHFDACFSLHTVHMVTCSLRVFNSVRLPDDWMLDSLHCFKCNSELCFHSYSTMITLWQYVTGTCY